MSHRLLGILTKPYMSLEKEWVSELWQMDQRTQACWSLTDHKLEHLNVTESEREREMCCRVTGHDFSEGCQSAAPCACLRLRYADDLGCIKITKFVFRDLG